LTQEQREFITLSRQQGEYLSELIDNLIVLNKLEANQIDEITVVPLDITKIAVDASNSGKMSALAKGLRFHLDIEPQLPQIVADETQITHLIKNLLSNAVKFTETGEIRLKITGIP
jgi:signal transduction histidine kinase